MQEAIRHPPSVSLRRMRARRTSRLARPTLTDTLRQTLSVVAKYPVAVLACALLCFGSAALSGTLLYAALNFSVFARNGNFFSAAPSILALQWLLQAALGTFGFVLGRGAITDIVMRAHAGQPASLRTALREALRKWRPLLMSSVLYGVLITMGVIGLTALLREARMDVTNYRWIRSDANSVMNMAFVRSISNLPPDPGAPFSELYAAVRYQLTRQSPANLIWGGFQISARNVSTHVVAIGALAIVTLVAVETLLCMRTAVIMRAPDARAPGWLRQTATLAAAHAWQVARWRWGVRFGLALLLAAFFVLPIALHQSVLVSAMIREVRAYWPYALNTALYSLAAALVGMVVFTFNTAFEAQMQLVLTEEHQ